MNSFIFANPTKIIFGKGMIGQLSKEIPPASRILLTYGGGSIFKNGVMDAVRLALKEHTVHEFGGIEVNPEYDTLMRAVKESREKQIDFILAVGGGSVLDGSKFIAAAVYFDGEAWDILAKKAKIHKALPVASVLTLPATGSESNANAVISRRSISAKLAFASAKVYPRFAILDPTTTFSLPERQVANGVIDPFVHIMEQYLTYPVGAKVQDRFAEGLLLTLIEEGPRTIEAPENYIVRANIMWSATMALNGLIGVGVPQDWTSHAIGHEITALYGLDHAQTLAIVLPALMTVRQREKAEKILQYGSRVLGISSGSETERIAATIAKTKQFFKALGVKTQFSEYGIQAEAVDKIIDQMEKHGVTNLGERGDISLADCRLILEQGL